MVAIFHHPDITTLVLLGKGNWKPHDVNFMIWGEGSVYMSPSATANTELQFSQLFSKIYILYKWHVRHVPTLVGLSCMGFYCILQLQCAFTNFSRINIRNIPKLSSFPFTSVHLEGIQCACGIQNCFWFVLFFQGKMFLFQNLVK